MRDYSEYQETGYINDAIFFDSAESAWANEGILPYFPGNIFGAGNVVDSLTALLTEVANSLIVDKSVPEAIADAFENSTSPGATASLLALMAYNPFGKTHDDMLEAGYTPVDGPNGYTLYLNDSGYVAAVIGLNLDDALVSIAQSLSAVFASLLPVGYDGFGLPYLSGPAILLEPAGLFHSIDAASL